MLTFILFSISNYGPNALGTLPSLLFLLGCAMTQEVNSSTPKRPHIVFMLADDLGWNDVSFHGSKQIPTPNVDAMARDGIILNQYYVQPICSPSRATLMTGKYPIRTGFQHAVIIADKPWGLPLNETTLPQRLKSLGYATHCVGKWHIGYFKEEYVPRERGFDSFFGYYNGLEDYFTHFSKWGDLDGLDLHEHGENVWKYNGTYGSDLFAAKAKKVILEHDPKTPLFLYFAQQSPHSGNFDNPLQAPEKYVEPMVAIPDQRRKIFAGMVSSMDYSVGEIIEALDESGMLNDTLFIFSTDNGAATVDAYSSGSNWPLKGCKFTLWEGGVRGVSFVWSSSLRLRSEIHNGLMHISDWLPTILSAAGDAEAVKLLPDDIDGIDQWASIANGASSPRSNILLNIDDYENMAAMRQGRFKLVKGTYENGTYDKYYDQEGRVFNITYSYITPEQKAIYAKNYMKFLSKSKAAKILQKRYGRDPLLASHCTTSKCRMDLEVKCGPRPFQSTCDSEKEACLFDIISDPCEFYNIADRYPKIVSNLQKQIEEYRSVEVPAKGTPGNPPPDPAANPKLHNNSWVPYE